MRLRKPSARSKQSERYAFLFDKVLILCKANSSGKAMQSLNQHSIATLGAAMGTALRTGERSAARPAEPAYRLKDLFDIFKLHITDRDDTDGIVLYDWTVLYSVQYNCTRTCTIYWPSIAQECNLRLVQRVLTNMICE